MFVSASADIPFMTHLKASYYLIDLPASLKISAENEARLLLFLTDHSIYVNNPNHTLLRFSHTS
jgi:hypothetical protein